MADENQSVLDALEYLEQGWQVIPIPRRTKSRQTKDWRLLRYTPEQVRNAFVDVNIGVMLGIISDNLHDVDLDEPIAAIVANELMPDTLTFGRKGKPMSHRLYRLTDFTSNVVKFYDPITKTILVELRGDGGLTVFPGSIHTSGEKIDWTENQRCIKPAESNREQLLNYVKLVASATLIAKYWGNSRHDTTLALTGWLARNRMGEEEIYSFIHAITSAANDEEQRDRLAVVSSTIERLENGENVSGYPTLKEFMDERILRAVAKWLELNVRSVEEMASINTTDEGNADRLVAQFGDVIRYCAEHRAWYVWNSKFWELDIKLRVTRMAAEVARNIYNEAADAATAAERAELAAWATQSNNRARLEAMVERAKGRPEVTISINEFDAYDDLLNVSNGTYDLDRETLLAHDKDHLLTKMANVTYDDSAPQPYLVFMAKQAVDDKDTLAALQKGFGLALSGRTDKAVYFCYGPTDTGKTTLLTQGMQVMLGTYAKQISLESIAGGRDRTKEMWIADMHGARYALASEPPRNFVLDTAAIKSMTGDSTQKARFLYSMPFDSVPRAAIFIDTNYRPDVPDSDDAIWNRIQLIFFKNRVKRDRGEAGYIPEFKLKIKEAIEMSGLLNWAIEGYKLWREEGLTKSEQMESMKQEYREEQDTVLQFINDCITMDENGAAEITSVWEKYSAWAKVQQLDVSSGRQTRNSLSDVLLSSHGWKKGQLRTKSGKILRVWLGVKILDSPMENLPYGQLNYERTFENLDDLKKEEE